MALSARLVPAGRRARRRRPVSVDPDVDHALLLAAFESTAALMLVLDPRGRIVRFNPAVERLTGRTAADVVGLAFWEVVGPGPAADALRTAFMAVRPEDYPNTYESDWLGSDGRRRRLAWNNTALVEGGEIRYAISTGVDVTEQRRAQDAIDAIESIGDLLAEEGPSASVLDRTLTILAERFGYEFLSIYLAEGGIVRLGAQIGYENPVELFDGSRGIVGRVIRTQKGAFVPDVSADPDYLEAEGIVRSEISLPLLEHAELLGVLNVEAARPALDVHDLSLVQAVADRVAGALALNRRLVQLETQAFHDALTGLANRALFADRTEHALKRHSRMARDVAVVFLDLDDFKKVNDGLGHAAGDELLRRVAERLQGAIRAGDTVARLGGDEFAVLLESVHGPDDAMMVADRLLDSLSTPFTIGREVVVSASAGVALTETTATELLRDADVAMYRAKHAGKSRCVLFEPTMREAAIERLDLERELRIAIRRHELFLVYQPIVDAETHRIVSLEALVRWRHPDRGVLEPRSFIELAEQTGLILPLGREVLRAACLQAGAWNEAGWAPLPVSVNVSPRQLGEPAFIKDVMDAVRDASLEPASLILEITESVLVQHPDRASETLRELRRLGVQIAIDDFGTGYSSLSYINDLPLDMLKVDRSFIGAVANRPAVVETLFRLGRVLGLRTVAEGIETIEELDAVRSLGAGLAQGYLFSRPLPADEVRRLIDVSRGVLRR
jgi:diguanylate cyclase (GGDEF)-like protein/PAS domain S-box-containing protein